MNSLHPHSPSGEEIYLKVQREQRGLKMSSNVPMGMEVEGLLKESDTGR